MFKQATPEQTKANRTRLEEYGLRNAGEIFHRMLKAVGLSPVNDVYLSNLIHCQPPGNRTPTTQECTKCQVALKTEIELIKPKMIFAVGATSSSFLLKRQVRITKEQGNIEDSPFGKVCPIVHPAYLMRIEGTSDGTKAKTEQLDAVKRALISIGYQFPIGK